MSLSNHNPTPVRSRGPSPSFNLANFSPHGAQAQGPPQGQGQGQNLPQGYVPQRKHLIHHMSDCDPSYPAPGSGTGPVVPNPIASSHPLSLSASGVGVGVVPNENENAKAKARASSPMNTMKSSASAKETVSQTNANANANATDNQNINTDNKNLSNAQASPAQLQTSPSSSSVVVDANDQFNPDGTYKRKDKSLGVLCVNFMLRYDKLRKDNPGFTPAVSIDEAAQTLQVERRRIYDIINILEAINVVSRKCKNTYNWHGMVDINKTFLKLQEEALDTFEEDAIRNGFRKEKSENDANEKEEKKEEVQPVKKAPMPTGLELLLASAEQVALATNEKSLKPKKAKPAAKEKSLGRLSQKFIQLFLVGNETIALNDASDKILGKTLVPEPAPGSSASEILLARSKANKMLKTKIRRLYDIANVMASIGLIAKLNGGNNLKKGTGRPSFKWIYPISPRDYLDKGMGVGNATVTMAVVDGAPIAASATVSAPAPSDAFNGTATSAPKDVTGTVSS